MKTPCKTCRYINLIETDFKGNPFCNLYDAFVYGHNEECPEWKAVSSPAEFYYYLNATPKAGVWVFSQQFTDRTNYVDYLEFDKVMSFGDGEYGVNIKTHSASPGMAFIKACGIITQHIKNQNNWRRDFGQI